MRRDTGENAVAGASLDFVLRQLRREAHDAGELTDGELLTHFARDRDETSFRLLMQRHGPMVLGVCRRVLNDPHDAEDAFQATFLVLVRKAESVRRLASVGSWLHGVALRVSWKARAAAARRRRAEKEAPAVSTTEASHACDWSDLRPVLDEEIDRLPQCYRAPLVLCCLEGKTYDEAAQQLGWAYGTVCGRLARARALLRSRLARRGVTLSAAALSSTLVGQATAAAVPVTLCEATLQGARLFAAGREVVGAVSANALTLTQEMLKTFLGARAKLAMLTGLVLLVLTASAGIAVQAPPVETLASAPRPEAVQRTAPQAEAPRDPLPPDALARLGTVRLRHTGRVWSVAVTPDGKVAVSGGWDGTVRIWDVATGKELRRLFADPETKPWIFGVAVSPDGKTLAATTHNRKIYFWDLATGRFLRQLPGHHEQTRSLAFTPDGKSLLLAGPDSTIRLIDANSGRQAWLLHADEEYVSALALAPRGKLAAWSGNVGTVHLLDVNTGREVRALRGHQAPVFGVAFSANGKRLASGCYKQTLRVWDVDSGKETLCISTPHGFIVAVGLSADGKRVVAAGDTPRQTGVWDATTGKLLYQRTPGHDALVVSADGIVVGAADHRVSVWDVETGRDRAAAAGHMAEIFGVAFSPDGKRIASAGLDHSARVWDRDGNELFRLVGHSNQVTSVAYSPDGKTLATGSIDTTVRLWDAATGRPLRVLRADSFSRETSSIAFSPDGKLLASGTYLSVLLWDVNTGRMVRRIQVTQTPRSVAFAPDGKRIASGCSPHGGARLWDVATGRPLRQVEPENPIYRVAFSPNGRVLATAALSSLQLWDVDSGRELRRLMLGVGEVRSLAFSSDGRRLAVGSDDGILRVVEIATGQECASFRGHGGRLCAVAFAPDDRAVASGSLDTTLLVWDVTARRDRRPGAALSAKELNALWSDLSGTDAARAYRALWVLADSPARSVPFLRGMLPNEPERVAQLIVLLDNSSFRVREKATAELEQLGSVAVPALRKALAESKSAEVRIRAERILEKLKGPYLEPERTPLVRAVEVLEHAGTAEARKALEDLAARSSKSWLATEARESLSRPAKH
jgi:RNA polymerase sigma factor (sigma-70 family)